MSKEQTDVIFYALVGVVILWNLGKLIINKNKVFNEVNYLQGTPYKSEEQQQSIILLASHYFTGLISTILFSLVETAAQVIVLFCLYKLITFSYFK